MMNTGPYINAKYCFRILFTFVCLFAFSANVEAKKGGRSTANIVSSVDTKRHTISIKSKVYVMSDRAKITVDGKKATISEVKAGMKVNMTAKVLTYGKAAGENVYQASRVTAITVKKPAKKKGKK